MIFIAQNHVDRHSAGISRHLCHGSRASARVCRAVSTSRNNPAHHLRSARNLRVRVGITPDNSRSITYTYDALDRLKTQVPNAANTSAATLSSDKWRGSTHSLFFATDFHRKNLIE